MNNFKTALGIKLVQSQSNNFGLDNYDEDRFGKFPELNIVQHIVIKLKSTIKKLIGYEKVQMSNRVNDFLIKYGKGLQNNYEYLNESGQELLVEIIAYRLLGYKKIKLSSNNKEYWDAIFIANSLADKNDIYDLHFLHFILQKCDLRIIGYDIQLYISSLGLAINFIIEQYAFKSGGKTIVAIEKGDVVLDLGACWGDTALYSASKTGDQGKVYSFEFVPENIKLFDINIALNSNLKDQIELIQHPVSDKSGDIIYYKEDGPGSRIEFTPFDEQKGQVSTISIDDFAKFKNLNKVDFIKMDIEGAEFIALEGAFETIRRFKPKLAISIYHSMEDFIKIPEWIMKLNLGYKLYLGHYTIHTEETVIFAKVEK